MDVIKYDSVPNEQWSLSTWVLWHKALVKHYNASTALVKKDGVSVYQNVPVATEFNSAFMKLADKFGGIGYTSFLPIKQIMSGLNSDKYKSEVKYFSMWSDTYPSSLIKAREHDPAFVFGETIDTILDYGKILKWAIIIGVPVLVVGFGFYIYGQVKGKNITIQNK
jgi:hypothetical protein